MDLPRYADAHLPPGCRSGDLHRAASRLDDLPPGRLWALLDERQQAALYRRFFHEEWAALATALNEEGTDLGKAVSAMWLSWRDAAVGRMAMSGLIREPA
jgi:hypothetical protein